jgi:hypothetical protein
MSYDATPNEKFPVQTVFVGREQQPALIVDDYLRDPDSVIRFAVNEARFRPSPVYYPGVVAATPAPYLEALALRLRPLIAQTFGVNPGTAEILSHFFAIVTLPPEKLTPLQLVPHVDDFHPHQIAILHYLCTGDQGGTAFFRHRATGYESLDAERFAEIVALNEKDIAANGPLPARYVDADNRLFEQTARIEPRLNRLLIYRSRVLHSGLIGPQTRLSPDPRVGRLTTNTFIRFAPA